MTSEAPAIDALLDRITFRMSVLEPRLRSPSWTAEEDQFLREHLGWLTDEEIGMALGRTAIAVHIRWDRDLGLPGPSKAPDVITAHLASRVLGIEEHKVAHWVDIGIIPGRIMAGGRRIRLIQREALKRWAANPVNWVYFDRKKVRDPGLKRLLALRSKRWGDEWWNTSRVAEYHGVTTSDVKRHIKMDRIRARRLEVSLSGRHENRAWSNWFILKSEATRKDLKIYQRGRGSPMVSRSFTPRADAWILKARDELGMTFQAIEKTMKIERKKCGAIISARYYLLKGLKKKNGGRG